RAMTRGWKRMWLFMPLGIFAACPPAWPAEFRGDERAVYADHWVYRRYCAGYEVPAEQLKYDHEREARLKFDADYARYVASTFKTTKERRAWKAARREALDGMVGLGGADKWGPEQGRPVQGRGAL